MCCQKPTGETPQERYAHYRRTRILCLLFWLIPSWGGLFFDFMAPELRPFYITRAVFWGMSLVLLIALLWVSEETSKRRLLLLAGASFLLPAGIGIVFFPVGSLTDNALLLLPEWTQISDFLAYLSGTGFGLLGAAQMIPDALQKISPQAPSLPTLWLITTVIGLGTRVTGYLVITQLWSLFDHWAGVYVMLWHILYVMQAYLRGKKWLCLYYALYVLIFMTALVRFGRLDPNIQETLLGIIGLYWRVTLRSTLMISLTSYFTATLGRLILLTHLVSPTHIILPETVELPPA